MPTTLQELLPKRGDKSSHARSTARMPGSFYGQLLQQKGATRSFDERQSSLTPTPDSAAAATHAFFSNLPHSAIMEGGRLPCASTTLFPRPGFNHERSFIDAKQFCHFPCRISQENKSANNRFLGNNTRLVKDTSF